MSAITVEELSKILKDYIVAQAERDAAQAKRDAEYDARRERDKADYERRHKRLQRELGRLGVSHGDQVEAMFVNLSPKFNRLGYHFPREAKGGATFFDENGKALAEVDRLLENSDFVMGVEVKAKLKKDDVDDHIERLKRISEHKARCNDGRKVIGAVLGGIVPQNLMKYAQKRGFTCLSKTGNPWKSRTFPKTSSCANGDGLNQVGSLFI